MFTDVTLRWPNHIRVVECKYTNSVYSSSQYGKMLNPAYLRQVYAYAMAILEWRGASGPESDFLTDSVDCVLLYAGETGDAERVELQAGQVSIGIESITLQLSWQHVSQRLMLNLKRGCPLHGHGIAV